MSNSKSLSSFCKEDIETEKIIRKKENEKQKETKRKTSCCGLNFAIILYLPVLFS